MCGIQGGGGVMHSVTTNASTTTSVAGASGGGGGGGAAIAPDVMAQLQALVAQIEGLMGALGGAGMLGGSGTISGGGGVVQQGDPTQVDPTQVGGVHQHGGDPTQGGDGTQVGGEHDHGDPTQGGDPTQAGGHAHGGDPTQGGDPGQTGHAHGTDGAGGGHGAHVVQRDEPENRKRAERIRDMTEKFFSDVKRSDVRFPEGGQTHGRLSEEMIAKFQKQFPNLPVPRSVVFTKNGHTPLGVVFNEKVSGDFDLGMGTGHTHGDKGVRMQHVWFVNDLDQAYTDRQKGQEVAKVVRAENAAEAGGKGKETDKAGGGGNGGKDKADGPNSGGGKDKADGDKGKADDKGGGKDKPKGKGK